MQLEFFGAAGEVTGSCHIVRVGGAQLLLDCGMVQGGRDAPRRNREPFPFDAASIDAVVLSHAHVDHCGRLPLLVKRGFRGPIYTNAACADLVPILLGLGRGLERALRHAGKTRAIGRDARFYPSAAQRLAEVQRYMAARPPAARGRTARR